MDSSIGGIVTDSVSHLLIFDIKERPKRPVTFETFDHLIIVMRKHYLTNMTMIILEICGLWDIDYNSNN